MQRLSRYAARWRRQLRGSCLFDHEKMRALLFRAFFHALLLCVIFCVVCPPLWGFCDALFLCDLLRRRTLCEGGTTGTEGLLKRFRAKGGGSPPSLRFLPRAPSSLLFHPHAPFYPVIKG